MFYHRQHNKFGSPPLAHLRIWQAQGRREMGMLGVAALDWHNGASYGVHFNRDLDIRLKQQCQERFEKLYGHDKFMEVFGKSWL